MGIISLKTSGSSVFISMMSNSSTSLPSFFRSTNNGGNWTQIGFGINGLFSKFDIVSNGTYLYLSSNLGVHISLDNGTSWTSRGLGMGSSVNDILINGSNIFAATRNGIYLSTNSGNSWSSVSYGLPSNTDIITLERIGAKLYAGTNSGLYSSVNNGSSWSLLALSDFTIWDLEYINNTLFASVQRISPTTITDLYASNDEGLSWFSSGNGNLGRISCIKSSGPVIFAGDGSGGGIYISTNNGLTWSQSNIGLVNSGKKVLALETDSNYVFAGSLNEGSNNNYWGGIFVSSNYGSSWNISSGLPNYYTLYSIKNIGSGILAGGNQIWYSTNNGNNWTSISGVSGDKWKVFESNSTEVFAGQGSYGSLPSSYHIGVWKNDVSSLTNVNHHQSSIANRKLINIIDILGRETKQTKQTNQPLFYIYDDGTVEKRIVIE